MQAKFWAMLAAGIVLAACRTTSADLPAEKVQQAKEVILKHCIIGYSDGAGSMSHTDKIGEGLTIHAITESTDSMWVRYDMSSKGTRDNVYYQSVTKSVVCGNNTWRDRGIRAHF